MTNYQEFFQIIWRRKWLIIGICLCSTLITAIVGICKNSRVDYQTRAEIYPTFVFKTTIEPWRLNPCYLTKRSLNSESFQNEVVGFSNTLPTHTLTKENYSQKIHWHETPQHTLFITVTDKNREASEATMNFILRELELVFWHYTSTVFLERGGYRNIDIADQENVMDTLPNHYLEIYDKEGAQFLIYDIISVPTTEALPFPTVKWTLFVTFLSLLFSSAILILIHHIKEEK